MEESEFWWWLMVVYGSFWESYRIIRSWKYSESYLQEYGNEEGVNIYGNEEGANIETRIFGIVFGVLQACNASQWALHAAIPATIAEEALQKAML